MHGCPPILLPGWMLMRSKGGARFTIPAERYYFSVDCQFSTTMIGDCRLAASCAEKRNLLRDAGSLIQTQRSLFDAVGQRRPSTISMTR